MVADFRDSHCATDWVFLNSQEDVPTLSQKKWETFIKKSNSHRAERRAQDSKPIGRPPKQGSRKSNRGRKPKGDLQGRFGDSLHAMAHINVAEEGDSDDELTAQPPVSKPSTRPWGTPLLRRDPTPAAAKPRSHHLGFLRACLHDTPGGALSWRHHLSA